MGSRDLLPRVADEDQILSAPRANARPGAGRDHRRIVGRRIMGQRSHSRGFLVRYHTFFASLLTCGNSALRSPVIHPSAAAGLWLRSWEASWLFLAIAFTSSVMSRLSAWIWPSRTSNFIRWKSINISYSS